MWVDTDSEITLETARFLGVPFAILKGELAPWSFIYRYRYTEDGLRLQYRYLSDKPCKWVDMHRDIFEERSDFRLYIVRPGRQPRRENVGR